MLIGSLLVSYRLLIGSLSVPIGFRQGNARQVQCKGIKVFQNKSGTTLKIAIPSHSP
jgi:hypothetical protein